MGTKGKVIVVTGAASGMGREAVRRYAKDGHKVLGIDVNENALKELASENSNIEYRVLDITNTSAVNKTIDSIQAEFGHIVRLINCAGVMPLDKIADQDIDVIKKIMDINYMGTVNMIKAVLPAMQARKSGEIVNFASTAAYIPSYNYGAYNASKFAVLAFTEVLHHELKAFGIKVICVCPSTTNTPMLNEATNLPGATTYFGVFEIPTILNAMEKAIKKGDLICIPGISPKVFVRLRAVAPALTWKITDFFDKRLDIIRPVARQ